MQMFYTNNLILSIFQDLAKKADGNPEKSDEETEKKAEDDRKDEEIDEEEYEEEDIEEVGLEHAIRPFQCIMQS